MKTVLLAEDDALLRNALNDKLTREGFTVHVARNGEECLERAFALHPDLILLDILMPKMGGIEVLTHLRRDAWGKTVKVILLTNVADAERIPGGSPYQSDGYLIKSDTKIGDVIAKVHEQLDMTSLIGLSLCPDTELPEHRCTCGKLLFKGTLLFSSIEIKCKRCGMIQRINNADQKLLG
jgi:CheY-like chemotaxis protein